MTGHEIEFVAMSLRYAVLGLLAQRPGSGYDLLQRFEESMANVWSATQSQLYGELNKLAKSGHIWVASTGPRGRKEYRITDEGRSDLVHWLGEPQSDAQHRSALLLQVFLLGQVSPTQARDHVDAFSARADEEVGRLESLRDTLTWDDSDDDFYAGAALDYGVRLAKLKGEWSRSLAQAIGDRWKS